MELGGLCLTPGSGLGLLKGLALPSCCWEWGGEGRRDKLGADNTAREKLRNSRDREGGFCLGDQPGHNHI